MLAARGGLTRAASRSVSRSASTRGGGSGGLRSIDDDDEESGAGMGDVEGEESSIASSSGSRSRGAASRVSTGSGGGGIVSETFDVGGASSPSKYRPGGLRWCQENLINTIMEAKSGLGHVMATAFYRLPSKK
ncbi:unnamed protein product [Protopolystoma xenopodis]|uniref:Uncharacterized protein n=1 Tax=Protopolystoma xenopodis TaxID=117903 RepID=A0A3S5BWH0_9PLAT|nr:unnamed protein product [Protopolystoma xenopodis]